MSAEALKVSSVLDTSHLKVKFPFKALNGNFTFKWEVSSTDDTFNASALIFSSLS